MSLNFYFDEIEGGTDVTHEWQVFSPTRHSGPWEEWPEHMRRINDDGEQEVLAMAALTHALIFNSMSIGIGHITADNAAEVYARSKIIEKFHGALVVYADPDKVFELTPEHIQQHIGLRTNVSFETREEWAQRMFIGHGDELSKDGDTLPSMGDEDDDVDYWDRRPDVSFTSQFRGEYRKMQRRQEREAAEA